MSEMAGIEWVQDPLWDWEDEGFCEICGDPGDFEYGEPDDILKPGAV